eukprot:GFYU01002531.1.p1 GENE.GFYU01002531.1~~GFYU01002531.1.p1  ORF type:complete len:372 (-),score=18.62 GFYU01002531.1:28-1014(-)
MFQCYQYVYQTNQFDVVSPQFVRQPVLIIHTTRRQPLCAAELAYVYHQHFDVCRGEVHDLSVCREPSEYLWLDYSLLQCGAETSCLPVMVLRHNLVQGFRRWLQKSWDMEQAAQPKTRKHSYKGTATYDLFLFCFASTHRASQSPMLRAMLQAERLESFQLGSNIDSSTGCMSYTVTAPCSPFFDEILGREWNVTRGCRGGTIACLPPFTISWNFAASTSIQITVGAFRFWNGSNQYKGMSVEKGHVMTKVVQVGNTNVFVRDTDKESEIATLRSQLSNLQIKNKKEPCPLELRAKVEKINKIVTAANQMDCPEYTADEEKETGTTVI